jgi:PAS domain S-box-containing protein
MPYDWPRPWQYILALGAIGAALLVRWLLDPILGENARFVLAFAALLPLVLLVRAGPFLAAAIAAWLGSVFLFVPVRMSLRFDENTAVLQSTALVGVIALATLTAWLSRTIMDDRLRKELAQHRSEQEAEAARAQVSAEAERQRRTYEAIISSTPDLVYVFDLDYRFTFANQALLAMWGRSSEESIGKTLLEVGYEPWHAEMHEREIDQVVATRKPIRGEVHFPHATLGRRIYDYIFVPVLDKSGAVEAVAGTTRDVTERKIAEDALREADRRKDEFLATLAHELRNPLGAIRTALSVIAMAGDDQADAGEMRAIIDRQSWLLVRLVDDLLDVSRISRGRIELRKARLDVCEIVGTLVRDSRGQCESKGIELSMALPDHPVYIDADPARFAQVVNNLLHNACKFTQRGHVRVRVALEGENAVVTVSDTGIGLAPEQLDRVFEMFAQVEGPLSRAESGLGIGLSLARSIMDLHGGSIEAYSAGPGQGSTFTVRLRAFVPLPA